MSEITLEELKQHRIKDARHTLLHHGERTGELLFGYDVDVPELIADLLHLAEAEGLDAQKILMQANQWFEHEKNAPPTTPSTVEF